MKIVAEKDKNVHKSIKIDRKNISQTKTVYKENDKWFTNLGTYGTADIKWQYIGYKNGSTIVPAGSTVPGTMGSYPYFIMYSDNHTYLDGQYAAFGIVISGMEVVDSFLEIERTMGNDGALSKPVEPIVIEKAEVL